MSVSTIQTVPIYPLSVRQYHRMIQAGILTEDDRVELLEGSLVTKMAHGPAHDGTISILARLAGRRLPQPDWLIRIQSAITLSKSEPEPDLAIVTGPEEKYLQHHPFPGDIGLLIEVADSSLDLDRTLKLISYARAGIQEYWIVNLIDCVIEVYTNPKSGRRPTYQNAQMFGIDDKVSLRLSGKVVDEISLKKLFRDR